MGDRTTLWITYRKRDEETVLTTLGWTLSDLPCLDPQATGEQITATLDEMNYGGYTELQELAKKGITFTAAAAAGCNYGESLCTGYRGKFADVPAVEGEPVCAITATCRPEPHALRNIRRYYRLFTKATKELDAAAGTKASPAVRTRRAA